MIAISQQYQDTINKHYKPIEDFNEEKEYIRLAKTGNKKASDILILSQLKTVLNVARQYKNTMMEMDDLVASGIMGIHKAIQKWEVERECRFITYATPWIKAAIAETVHENNLIHHPANILLDIKKQEKSIKNGELDESDATILKYMVRSFDEPLANQGGAEITIGDKLGILDDNINHIENMIGIDKVLLVIDDIYAKKDEDGNVLEMSNERLIFELMFGLNGRDVHTLDETGKILNLTRERIRQIKERVSETVQKRMKIYF